MVNIQSGCLLFLFFAFSCVANGYETENDGRDD